MEESPAIALRLYEKFCDQIINGFSDAQIQDVKEAFIPWIQAKLDQYDPELYSQDEYIEGVIPEEISYLFQDLNTEQRYEQAVTAYDRLRVQILNSETYERARLFLQKAGDVERQKESAEEDLRELKEIEGRLSAAHPAIYKQLKRQISESKLDCLYVIRDGGAASLRLGREIQRSNQS